MNQLAKDFAGIMRTARKLKKQLEADPSFAPVVEPGVRNIITYFPDGSAISPQVVVTPCERVDNTNLVAAISRELALSPEFARIKKWVEGQPVKGQYTYQGVELLCGEAARRAVINERKYSDVLQRFRRTLTGRPFLSTSFQAVYGVTFTGDPLEVRRRGAAIRFRAAIEPELQAGADRAGPQWQARAVPSLSVFCSCKDRHPYGGPSERLETMALKMLGLYRVGWIVPCFSMFWSEALLRNGGFNVGTAAPYGFGSTFELSGAEQPEFELHCMRIWKPLWDLEDLRSETLEYIRISYDNYIKALGDHLMDERNISDVMVALDGLLVGRNEDKLKSLKKRVPLLCDLCETGAAIDRPALEKLIDVAYDVRSRVSHGNPQDRKLWDKLDQRAAPFGGIPTLFDICRRALLICVSLGLPKSKLIAKLDRAIQGPRGRALLENSVRAKVGRISSLSRAFAPPLSIKPTPPEPPLPPGFPGEGWRRLKVGDVLGLR